MEIPESGKLVVCPTCGYRFYVTPDGSTTRRQPPPQPSPAPPPPNERHVAFVRQLEQEMPGWIRDGIISTDQHQQILDRYTRLRRPDARPGRGRLVRVIALLGLTLLGATLCVFIAANWAGLPREARIGGIALLMLASHGGGYFLRYGSRPHPRAGGALILLGCLIFGAAVYAVARLYHLNVHPHELAPLWGAAILPLAYLTTLPTLLFAALAALLAGLAMEGGARPGNSHELAPVMLVGAAGVWTWLMGGLHRLRPNLWGLAHPWQLTGSVASLGALFVFTFPYPYRQQLSMGGLSRLHAAIAVVTLATAAGLLAGNRSKPQGWHEPVAGIILLTFFLLAASGALALPGLALPASILFNLLYALLLLGLVVHGFRHRSMGQINIALFFFVADLIARYMDIFWTILPRPLFFIAGGVLLIAGGAFLERKRRIAIANLLDMGEDNGP